MTNYITKPFTTEYKTRLAQFCNGNFDWSFLQKIGAYISGGCAELVYNTSHNINDFKSSDIDIYVFGVEMFNTLCEILVLNLPIRPYCYITTNTGVFTITTERTDLVGTAFKTIQIIVCKEEHNLEWIHSQYDYSHCKIAFDGVNFYITPEAQLAISSGITQWIPVNTSNLVERYNKTLKRGYTIETDYLEYLDSIDKTKDKPDEHTRYWSIKNYTCDIRNIQDITNINPVKGFHSYWCKPLEYYMLDDLPSLNLDIKCEGNIKYIWRVGILLPIIKRKDNIFICNLNTLLDICKNIFENTKLEFSDTFGVKVDENVIKITNMYISNKSTHLCIRIVNVDNEVKIVVCGYYYQLDNSYKFNNPYKCVNPKLILDNTKNTLVKSASKV
jgi:hypothetical protein